MQWWRAKPGKQAEDKQSFFHVTVTAPNSQAQQWSTVPKASNRGEQPSTATHNTLHRMADKGDAEELRRLLRAPAWAKLVGGPDQDRRSPLHFACFSGHCEAVQVLLSAGAALGAADVQGATPLHLAAAGGHATVVALLLAAGADAHAQDVRGQLPQRGSSQPESAKLAAHARQRCPKASSTSNAASYQGPPASDPLEGERAAYERAWTRFSAFPGSPRQRTYADTPWPTLSASESRTLDVLLHGAQGARERRAQLRQELLRWHADKFQAAHGPRLAPGERARILVRVTGISQLLMAAYRKR
ncbi:hypothetical protein WJX81_007540 [Elliptochloris bilobata]|uniref:NF-kappa-B inhibitor-like protein 1 n=1 Tax=Elliptochloris bilobata TaxID=381761 RepID=A0AAW1SI18_9CHLO